MTWWRCCTRPFRVRRDVVSLSVTGEAWQRGLEEATDFLVGLSERGHTAFEGCGGLVASIPDGQQAKRVIEEYAFEFERGGLARVSAAEGRAPTEGIGMKEISCDLAGDEWVVVEIHIEQRKADRGAVNEL